MYKQHQIEAAILDGRLFAGIHPDSISLCMHADVIILHAAILPIAHRAIQHWRARDKIIIADLSTPIVYDLEIHRLQIGPVLIQSSDGELVPPLTVDGNEFIWSLKLVDGAFSNSRLIVEDWKGILDVRFIPDWIDLDRLLIHPYESHDGIILGVNLVEGGLNKLQNTGALQAIEAVAGRHPEVKLILFGEHSRNSHLLEMPQERKYFLPPMEKVQWGSILPSIDIGLLPRMGELDDRMGREAVLEFMALKIPWVGSESPSLFDQRGYGWLVQNQTDLWITVLEDLIANIDHYRRDSLDAYLFSLGQGLDENFNQLITSCLYIRSQVLDGVS
jgi:glycosyltransferase involved in cell wall biosynthesis